MALQKKLQTLRKQKGMTQESLAEKLGITRQAVANWEMGISCPDLENLIQLSDLFHISLDDLVRDREQENCSNHPPRKVEIENEKAIQFLLRAKRSTYAGKGKETTSSRPESHDLEYCDEPFYYLDSYLGGERFAGEEALWKDNVPFWAMNYVGRILSDGFSGDFLKEALLLVPEEYPFRGPLSYHNGDHHYHCQVEGTFEWFSGREEIFFKNQKVYECLFHGGIMK